MKYVYCVMITGHTITEDIAWKLFFTAQEMLKKSKDRLSFRDQSCEGMMVTAWDIEGMGSVYGYKFSAELEWGTNKTTITFLARKTDLGRDDLCFVNVLDFFQ